MLLQILTICGISFIVLYLCLFVLYQLRASRFLSTSKQRLNVILVLFYLTIPNIMAAFLLWQAMHGDTRIIQAYVVLLSINIGFFLFGIAEEIRLHYEKLDKPYLLHHIAFALSLFLFILSGDFPSYFIWILVVQNVGIFLFSKKVLLEIEGEAYQPQIKLIETLDFWFFFFVRVIPGKCIAVVEFLNYPAGTWRQKDVVTTSFQHIDVMLAS